MQKKCKHKTESARKLFLLNEDELCMYIGLNAPEDILKWLEKDCEELKITKRVFSCVLEIALRYIIRTLPRSVNPTGEMYSTMEDVDSKHPGDLIANKFLRLLVCMVKSLDRDVVAELFPRKVILKLVGMIRSDNVEERQHVFSLLINISRHPECLSTTFLGLSNELINFIESSRPHVGIEEVLGIVSAFLSRRAIPEEDVVIFHHQVVLRMARIRFCGESKEVPVVMKIISRNYPKTIPLTIRHFKKVFMGTWSSTRVTIVHVIGEILRTINDEMYQGLESEICEVISMSFDSDHHLVVEEVAEMLALNRWVVSRHAETFVPKVFESIYRASKRFWRVEGVNKILRNLSTILDVDCRLFEKCLKLYNMKRWRDKWTRDR
ncbi:SER/THR PROTEIN PHOSPHATASE 2A REGULATORY SUBUNIT BETA [Encephalitozoon cuniculi GB-M1]|uniref:SER/THR PROTEIN PHOSPHATASE 2A REGULATORY SUBUNIT BETA n=1 Tax=Encephalitozoon cuniculi (strain GB-M1) TaxID=284813 RepID=Q8SS70_ENCCU|nr:uncharacterized protein ECU04_0200 [Encephalitozoon cuniculi GB-M1]CAD25208.2 SER/THR PROTEIN PHOSPHATASE 2A REGULATORY SUBUNIT BETA [Encephalitozoon cuniculi GB-M1]